MTLLWTTADLVAAAQATPVGFAGQAGGITGIDIDSRVLKTGEMFVALKDERDGHDYVAGANAALALVSRLIDGAGPQLLVDDTLKALERIGVAARGRAGAQRIAVTGSVGKTSVTRAIEAGLKHAGRAHGPVGSFNNHIGVPLTLARMPADTERAVFEVGMNHAGEITPLTQMVQPHVAVVTTVGGVHTEHFPDGEAGIARAKAEIFAGLVPGGTAVLNRDNPWYDLLAAEATKAGARIASFGHHADATLRLTSTHMIGGSRINLITQQNGRTETYAMHDMGKHWTLNALAVALALEAGGIDQPTIHATLAGLTAPEGRGQKHRVTSGDSTYLLIDDAYNANPLSLRAALAVLGSAPVGTNGRRIAVLTDMLELGSDAPAQHAALADAIDANSIDLVFCAGALMQALYEALPPAQRGAWAPDANTLTAQVQAAARAGDAVMVKGSKGSKASAIVAALLASKAA